MNPNDPTAIHIRRARADELEGLLADTPDTDTEAERMSLHSNPGRGKKRSKRKRESRKKISQARYYWLCKSWAQFVKISRTQWDCDHILQGGGLYGCVSPFLTS